MTYSTEFDDDGMPVRRTTLPSGDFDDPRQGIASDGRVWGDAPRRELAPVESVLDDVLGKLAAPERTTLEQVSTAWEQVCGAPWSNAAPVRCDGETLVVEVPNGLVASQLQFDTTRVIAGLRDRAAPRLRRIRFRVKRT